MKNLKEMTSKELKAMAKELGIKNWWNLNKETLIIEIEKLQNASAEDQAAAKEYEEKEKAAVAEYTANWTKYTKRYNVGEFLEKWRSGKIVLESEGAAVEVVREEMENNGIKPSKDDYENKPKTVEEKPQKQQAKKPAPVVEPEEEITPFIYMDDDDNEWEDYDIGEKMKKWSDEKITELRKYFDESCVGSIDKLTETIDAWSAQYDEEHGIKKTANEGHAPSPKRGALIEYNGKSQNICAWGEELGISANTLYGRLYKLGWSVEKAFTKKQ